MVGIYSVVEQDTLPIIPLTATTFEAWLSGQAAQVVNWVNSCQFQAEPLQLCYIPDQQGRLSMVLFGIQNAADYWAFGQLPRVLTHGQYRLVNENNFFDEQQIDRNLMAWGLGCYTFSSYAKRDQPTCQIYVASKAQALALETLVDNLFLVRDLINTPANDLGPDELVDIAVKIATECGASSSVIKGEDLVAQNFPTIYAVGKGAAKAPALIDIKWGDEHAPKVTLVGKGVCFDSGGLDLKSAANMLLMKKDMGGAAHVLALARLIMQSNLPVRLRVLIPTVENSVDGHSYRPGDVIKTRSGKTVEVGNTDAEGRLILCDALTEAVQDSPDYLIDMATLTGAARIALGPDIAALMSNQDDFATEMLAASHKVQEPVWQLPLYTPYKTFIKSDIADLSNTGKTPLGGAITAGLFLQHFVPPAIPWIHFDIMAYNMETKPGRPVGGEAMAFRTVFQFLVDKFST